MTKVFKKQDANGEEDIPLPEPAFSMLHKPPEEPKPKQDAPEDGSVPDKIPPIDDNPPYLGKPPEIITNIEPPEEEKASEETSYEPEDDLNTVVMDVFGDFSTTRSEPAEAESTPEVKSFFNRFEEFLKEKNYDEELIANLQGKDLFDKMKTFHEYTKKGKPFVFDAKDVTFMLSKKMRELKKLEKEWEIGNEKLESHKRFIQEKEEEIRNRIAELKEVIAYFKKIKKNDLIETKGDTKLEKGIIMNSDHYFYLKDGTALKSLEDLHDALKTMGDDVFAHHVSSEKNDFAAWVENIFQDPLLSYKMEHTGSREELLSLLQSAL